MARSLSISQKFLKGHPKEGQSTDFEKKIYKSIIHPESDMGKALFPTIDFENVKPKHHSFRGHTQIPWKAGDRARLFCWDGKPYGKEVKQLVIAEVELKQVWRWELLRNRQNGEYWGLNIVYPPINDGFELSTIVSFKDGTNQWTDVFRLIALNDGFDDPQDLIDWLAADKDKIADIGGQLLVWGDI